MDGVGMGRETVCRVGRRCVSVLQAFQRNTRLQQLQSGCSISGMSGEHAICSGLDLLYAKDDPASRRQDDVVDRD
jgi:hypothetical protein